MRRFLIPFLAVFLAGCATVATDPPPLEVLLAREVSPGKYRAPAHIDDAKLPNFGMIYPRPVRVRSAGRDAEEKIQFFGVDPGLFAIARRAASDVTLERCDARKHCLDH